METAALQFFMSVLTASTHKAWLDDASSYAECTKDLEKKFCRHRPLEDVLYCLKERIPKTFNQNAEDFAVHLNMDADFVKYGSVAFCSYINKVNSSVIECLVKHKEGLIKCHQRIVVLREQLFRNYKKNRTTEECAKHTSCRHYETVKTCFAQSIPCDPIAIDIASRSQIFFFYGKCNKTTANGDSDDCNDVNTVTYATISDVPTINESSGLQYHAIVCVFVVLLAIINHVIDC